MKRSAHPLVIVLACAAALTLLHAPAALAHAELLGSSPAAGATVQRAPREVVFEFNEAVGGTAGAVRVYDARGAQVDDLDVSHPRGHSHWLGVGLKPGLPDGAYTATYRVISADTHIVYGGLVFNIGQAGTRPALAVSGLLAHERSGPATAIAFGAVRGLDYLSIALMLGGLAFFMLAWLPIAAGADALPARTVHAFAARWRTLLLIAVAVGFAVSVLGILLQGASAAGVSLWESLRSAIVKDTLHSRFGEVWGARAIDWALLGAALLGTSTRDRPARHAAVALALGSSYLALTPALAGHASTESPTAVLLAADFLHVLAASVWVGGIACLLFVLPSATRTLAREQRGQTLLAVLVRFSPLALAAVITIAASGILQAYIYVRSLHALLHSTYGALLLVKSGLLLGLIGCGWINRRRVIPALERIASASGSPGAAGLLARRTLRGELALMAIVLGVTAALITYTPPVDIARGPFAANARLGDATLELSVEPARASANAIHLYLFDARSGAQFTRTRELTVTAALPAKQIGPLPLKATLTGPGHYTLDGAELTPAGTWQLRFTDRVSEFDEYSHTVSVPIR